ncbi:MAG: pantetheine-phosphate adenylyltransferase [Pantoea sp. Brub]|nr:pantetheine-phosphate adenylyltransferase [Pantoea sp. Brub]
MKKTAIYPGTFDPITLGHLDILIRAAKLFDYVILAIAENPKKQPLFTLEERITLADIVTSDLINVKVLGYKNLIVNFAKEHKVNILIRGLRLISDFTYEMQLANMNRTLNPILESVFIIPSKQFLFISSSLIKEIAYYGGDVSSFLHVSVHEALISKVKIDLINNKN